jgi:hypothetical protein
MTRWAVVEGLIVLQYWERTREIGKDVYLLASLSSGQVSSVMSIHLAETSSVLRWRRTMGAVNTCTNIVILSILIAFEQTPFLKEQNALQDLPPKIYYEDPLVIAAHIKGFWPAKYEICSNQQNPYYLRADFDGDGEIDVVVRVLNRTTGAPALVFINTSQDTSWVVGDGQRDPETGAQLVGSYMRVITKGTNVKYFVPSSHTQDNIILQHDGLEVGRGESFAVLYYWRNGIYDMLVIRD